MDINLTFSQISDAANEAYQYARQQKGGANANYIPYLANIDSGLFGLSVMLPDGRSVNVGDTGYRFGRPVLRQYCRKSALMLPACLSIRFLQFFWKMIIRRHHLSMPEP